MSPVARDVLQRRVQQPEPVVGEARAHALAARLVPPVLDVAFDELPRGGVEEVLARDVAAAASTSASDVLQLIAEAEGAARLVERRRPQMRQLSVW